MGWFIFAMFWIACGIVSAGMMNADFRGEFDSITYSDNAGRENLGRAVMFGLLFGPIGIVVGFFLSGFLRYGWSLRWRADERKNSNG